MNTKHKKPTLTKKQRHKLRVQQVRRQKIFLTCLFLLIVGCILLRFSKFSGRQKETHQINAACEAYRDEVSSEAAQYDMSDYVDLILAVMMQESSGCGPDVLQSSEGAYNKKYPQVPNGITDTSYSIECGIQELKYAMEKAGVSSPTDMDRIRLALQALMPCVFFGGGLRADERDLQLTQLGVLADRGTQGVALVLRDFYADEHRRVFAGFEALDDAIGAV